MHLNACVLKHFVLVDSFAKHYLPPSLFALQKNIVHRDLKLGNMVLNKR